MLFKYYFSSNKLWLLLYEIQDIKTTFSTSNNGVTRMQVVVIEKSVLDKLFYSVDNNVTIDSLILTFISLYLFSIYTYSDT